MAMTCKNCNIPMVKVYRCEGNGTKELFMCPACKRETRERVFTGFKSKNDKTTGDMKGKGNKKSVRSVHNKSKKRS